MRRRSSGSRSRDAADRASYAAIRGKDFFPRIVRDVGKFTAYQQQMGITSPLQQAQSSRGDVELSHVVFINDIPVTGEVGVGRGRLENNGGTAQEKRSIYNVGVSGNPTHITTAEVG